MNNMLSGKKCSFCRSTYYDYCAHCNWKCARCSSIVLNSASHHCTATQGTGTGLNAPNNRQTQPQFPASPRYAAAIDDRPTESSLPNPESEPEIKDEDCVRLVVCRGRGCGCVYSAGTCPTHGNQHLEKLR